MNQLPTLGHKPRRQAAQFRAGERATARKGLTACRLELDRLLQAPEADVTRRGQLHEEIALYNQTLTAAPRRRQFRRGGAR